MSTPPSNAGKPSPAAQPPARASRSRRKPRSDTFVATDQQRKIVEALTGYGFRQEDVAKLVVNPVTGKGISPVTLRENFREELDRGQATTNSKVINALYANAVENNNVTAQIFWLKVRAGWRENEDPQAINVNVGVAIQANMDLARRIAFSLQDSIRRKEQVSALPPADPEPRPSGEKQGSS